MYKEIKVKTALNKLKRRVPYGWDLNIYRGCEHKCQYCYAMYSHTYLNSKNFFSEIFIKTNIAEQLEKELNSNNWKGDIINIGGVTDSYQPIEAKYGLMRKILKLMIKYKNPVIISTKSNLILRDYDLINRLSKLTYVNIATTITTMDENIRKKIEPYSHSSKERFDILKKYRKTNSSTGLHVMPIIPYITDNENNFEQMFASANMCHVDYVLTGTLYLRGNTRPHFFEFIKNFFPGFYDKYLQLYKKGGAGKEYKTELHKMVNRIRNKYQLSNNYMKPIKEKLPDLYSL